MIPNVLHQVWIGPKNPPWHWIDTWRDKHPDWKHVLWDDDKVRLFGLANQNIYDYYAEKDCWHGASNIVRYEVLERYGGVYIDADTTCVKSITGASFMQDDFFASYSPNLPDRVSCGFVGSTKNHPILTECVERLGYLTVYEPPWNTVGGTLLTKVVKGFTKVNILPAKTFYGVDIKGQPIAGDSTQYGIHHAGSSHDLYE